MNVGAICDECNYSFFRVGDFLDKNNILLCPACNNQIPTTYTFYYGEEEISSEYVEVQIEEDYLEVQIEEDHLEVQNEG